jgi:hypothetical protein
LDIGIWSYLENKFVTPTPPSPLGGGGDGWGGIFIVRELRIRYVKFIWDLEFVIWDFRRYGQCSLFYALRWKIRLVLDLNLGECYFL